jgi:hypothetical protein
MNIRPFDWRDLTLLHGYLNRGVFLDSTRALIHGKSVISMGAFLSFLGPSTRMFTYRCNHDSPSGTPIIGQISYSTGASYAHLSFLAPEDAVDQAELAALSDYMAEEMGKKGAFHILADVNESSQVFQLLHRAGFAIYARQRIWRLDGKPLGDQDPVPWKTALSRDAIGMRSLYCNVVPGLVQQVEPLPKKNLKGVVLYKGGDVIAFVELKYGRNGIWMQPFIHPDVGDFDCSLVHLLHDLPGRGNRPLYLCVRSYQSWLEAAIEAMGAEPGPVQAVMVRHLTVAQRVTQAYKVPAMNGGRAEPTAPIAQVNESRYQEPAEVERQSGVNTIS